MGGQKSEEPPLWTPKIDRGGRDLDWQLFARRTEEAQRVRRGALNDGAQFARHNGRLRAPEPFHPFKDKKYHSVLLIQKRSDESARLLVLNDGLRICD